MRSDITKYHADCDGYAEYLQMRQSVPGSCRGEGFQACRAYYSSNHQPVIPPAPAYHEKPNVKSQGQAY